MDRLIILHARRATTIAQIQFRQTQSSSTCSRCPAGSGPGTIVLQAIVAGPEGFLLTNAIEVVWP